MKTQLSDVFVGLCFLCFVCGSIGQPCNGGPCGENAVYCFDETLEQWQCKCIRGFKSISVTPINCTDINECNEGKMHNCGNHTRCRNAIGYYTCECIPGFEKLQANGGKWECSDFNECGAWPRNNCGNGTECVNTFGGYTCQCEPGYTNPTISYGQTFCSDLDECATNSHNCGDGTWCQNRVGSYRCNCAPGYRRVGLVSDMNICTDVDECTADADKRCGNHSRCINTPGSFTCVCVSGFISSSGDGHNCADPRVAAVPGPSVLDAKTKGTPSVDLLEGEEENGSGDLYVGVGVGIGAAFVIIAIFFMVAYIAGSERKKGKQSIQHDVHKYQVDPKHHFIDTDCPIYEDIGPPLTAISPAVDRANTLNVPVASATLGRRQPVRTVSECVDNKSVQNWRLVHNEINQALYAASDFDDTPIYCNTMERNKRTRPRLEPMVEELYYSPVYHSCDNIHSMTTSQPRPKPAVAPKQRHMVDRVHTHSPKRHVIRRNKQRLWVSRVHSEADANPGPKRRDKAPDLQPSHPAFRRLASEGDVIDAKKQQTSNHDLMEGTILRCGDKYYILEPQERDEVTGEPTLFGLSKQHADEAL